MVHDARAEKPEPSASDAHEQEAASFEVDITLLHWFASLSLRERLRAASRFTRVLGRFRDVPTSE